LTNIGGFGYSNYWSSSEFNSDYYAWIQYFGNGWQGNGYKAFAYSVRAVRAF